jgi:hypothetical protein
MEFKFTKINISEYERFWLKQIIVEIDSRLKNNCNYDDEIKKILKEFQQIGFDRKKINRILFIDNHVTLLGLYHIYPANEVFENIRKIISFVKKKIYENSNDKGKAQDLKFKIKDLHNVSNIPECEIKYALFLLKDLGYFSDCWESIKDYDFIDLSKPNVLNAYLNFNGLDELIENFYVINKDTDEVTTFNIFIQFIYNTINLITKKEIIYLAFFGGVLWLALYLINNSIPIPNSLNDITIIFVFIAFSVTILFFIGLISIFYFPLYLALIDESKIKKFILKEDSTINYFFKIFSATAISLVIFISLFYLINYLSAYEKYLGILIILSAFILYPLIKFLIFKFGFKKFIIYFLIIYLIYFLIIYLKIYAACIILSVILFIILVCLIVYKIDFHFIKTNFFKNFFKLLNIIPDGMFFIALFILFIPMNNNVLNNFAINSKSNLIYILYFVGYALFILLFSFLTNSILANFIIKKVIIDREQLSDYIENGNKYSNYALIKTIFERGTITYSILMGLFFIIYPMFTIGALNPKAIINNSFLDIKIGYYNTIMILNNNYFEKIKRKNFLNSDLIILNRLSCSYIKSKKNNKKHSNYYECDFKIRNISKNKKYYFAEYPYGQYEKPQFFKLNLPIKYIKSKIKKLFTIKLNKILFQKYLNNLKNKNTKDNQINLVRNIVVNNATTAPSYCYIGAKSTICKFFVLLNLGSNYVVRINNNTSQENKQQSQNFSIITIPKKYVLSTRLNISFNKLK